MGFAEKMEKLLDHWIRHNADHAKNYREWAQKASSNGLSEAAGYLNEAADMTDRISEQFKGAADTVKKKG